FDETVEHLLAQPEAAGGLRIDPARGDEAVRGRVLLGVDAVAVEANGALLREPRRERSAPRTELDDENQDDGEHDAADEDLSHAAGSEKSQHGRVRAGPDIPCPRRSNHPAWIPRLSKRRSVDESASWCRFRTRPAPRPRVPYRLFVAPVGESGRLALSGDAF